MLLNPLITNRNRRALGDEWRDGYRGLTVPPTLLAAIIGAALSRGASRNGA